VTQITDPLVLPADVRLVPVADLAEDVRRHLEWVEGDVAIARLRSRTPSKVISAGTAALVEQFRSPKKMVEAIIRYSLANGADPRATLQSAFPILQQLITAGLLVPADSSAAEQMELALHAGDQVDGFTVVYPVHFLEDVELYQARADAEHGATVALKIARPDVGPGIAYMLDREAAVLRLLDGDFSPAVVATGKHQDRHYLAMTWCEGISADAAAAELRRDDAPGSRHAQLGLCESILRAYAALHSQRIIHGDIHPNNILVDGAGAVRLIDFGLARVPDPARGLKEPYRGGVAFFYEPEYAAAARAGKSPPPASEAGEQYGLAVLLYYLLTGVHYLDFSLEQDEMLRQIAEDSPLPFVRQGLEAWPSVERALARALSKDAAERYEDVAAFAAELRAIASSLKNEASAAGAPPRADPTAEALRSEVLARVALNGSVFVNGLSKAPTASINMGAAGIAWMLYRMACTRSDPALLALADVWATRAAASVGDDAGFYNPDIELTPEVVGRISPYHNPTGVFAVQALIAQARGDRMGEEVAVHRFVAAADQPCDNLDITLGKSGLLIAGALLYEALADQAVAERTGLLAVGHATMTDIWRTLDSYSPIQAARELPNLGIAHGWGGMLYATLRWCAVTGAGLPAHTQERLHQLAALAEPIGRGIRWPWQLDQPGLYMAGWCNGSTGYVLLWTLAHQTVGEPAYRSLAEKAAWNCWEDQAQIGSLCCGLTGRAYALLHWYKQTGDDVWLRRAVALANQAAVSIRTAQPEDERGFENSLYKGELGVAALIADLDNPESAALPFFESEGWPPLCPVN
jgi:serine/threonine protein kinase